MLKPQAVNEVPPYPLTLTPLSLSNIPPHTSLLSLSPSQAWASSIPHPHTHTYRHTHTHMHEYWAVPMLHAIRDKSWRELIEPNDSTLHPGTRGFQIPDAWSLIDTRLPALRVNTPRAGLRLRQTEKIEEKGKKTKLREFFLVKVLLTIQVTLSHHINSKFILFHCLHSLGYHLFIYSHS